MTHHHGTETKMSLGVERERQKEEERRVNTKSIRRCMHSEIGSVCTQKLELSPIRGCDPNYYRILQWLITNFVTTN